MLPLAKTFDECGFEKELIDYLNSIGFKQPIGLQQQLLPLMVQQNYDIILNGGPKSGKTIGYLLPIINQILKNNKKNNKSALEKTPIGIILMNRPSLIQSVTEQLNLLCQGLNISIISKHKKNLPANLSHGVDIIITKVEILRQSMICLGPAVSGIKYIVVDQANLFSKGDGKCALKEVYNYIQHFGNTEFKSVFSSLDFRNEEHNLVYSFFGSNFKIISDFFGSINRNDFKNNSPSKINNIKLPKMNHSNVMNIFNDTENKKIIYSIPMEYITINIFDSFKVISKIVHKLFNDNSLINIVIFTPTSHVGQYLNYLLTKTHNKVIYISESLNYDNLNLNNNYETSTETIFIIGDDVKNKTNYIVDNIIFIHQQIPPTRTIYERRISIFNNSFNNLIKSIIIDSHDKIINFRSLIV
uniref:ATP-dependent RNA helicase n=1 Tax=Strongyloides stercoralis TaxID=6248 RepID=A0A0K0EFG6_STRER